MSFYLSKKYMKFQLTSSEIKLSVEKILEIWFLMGDTDVLLINEISWFFYIIYVDFYLQKINLIYQRI